MYEIFDTIMNFNDVVMKNWHLSQVVLQHIIHHNSIFIHSQDMLPLRRVIMEILIERFNQLLKMLESLLIGNPLKTAVILDQENCQFFSTLDEKKIGIGLTPITAYGMWRALADSSDHRLAPQIYCKVIENINWFQVLVRKLSDDSLSILT